jgi:hypothetical protein
MRIFLSLPYALVGLALLVPNLAGGEDRQADLSRILGTAIDHRPASEEVYNGSPSLAVLENGAYVASHDEFGPESSEFELAVTRVFRSPDRGRTWQQIATINGQFWSTLFHHADSLYLLGTDKHHGNVVIRRSDDGGVTWSEPSDSTHGLLSEGQYHCSPQPVIIHRGRLWRAMEDAAGGERWGERYRPLMMSAPVEADLLRRDSWTWSNFVPGHREWLDGRFVGWLEGNAVVDPQGEIVNILRVAGAADVCGTAALVRISVDGRQATFDPAKDFIKFPGGAKKFTIRHDAKSDRYYSLANVVLPQYRRKRSCAAIRNTLALTSSSNLCDWRVDHIVLHDQSLNKGYQYADWLFEGDDLIAVVRTAEDDGLGGAHNYHDANFMTFHRLRNFRAAKSGDGVKPDGWIALFDGTSLKHWRGYQQEDVPDGWRIEGGLLKLQGGEIDLVTREEFADFELRFEWRIGSGGNSGVIYRCDEDEPASYRTGPEYQLIDNSGWQLNPQDAIAAGALYGLYRPKEDASRPAGEWNEARIIIDGGRIEHWLNGVQLVEARLGSDEWLQRMKGTKLAEWPRFGQLPRGHIALQAHKGRDGQVVPIGFRHIEIRRLNEPSSGGGTPAAAP